MSVVAEIGPRPFSVDCLPGLNSPLVSASVETRISSRRFVVFALSKHGFSLMKCTRKSPLFGSGNTLGFGRLSTMGIDSAIHLFFCANAWRRVHQLVASWNVRKSFLCHLRMQTRGSVSSNFSRRGMFDGGECLKGKTKTRYHQQILPID